MAEQDLNAVAFPRLDAEQMAALEACPSVRLRPYRDGDKLFEACAPRWDFYVVKSGKVEVVDDSGGKPRTLVVHGPGEFVGEEGQLAGRPAPVTAIARGDTAAYEVSPDCLRDLVNRKPELGDLILRAFLARRQMLRESGAFTGLRVIGSRYSPDTFRVRDFLARNRLAFTWLDLEADPEAQRLLERLGVTVADTPVVLWGHKLLLRNPSNERLAETIGLRQPLGRAVYDLVVVGAGPAGLAAAVYGASEGLSTVVLERVAPGGQAGRSMRIENYLGFPTGISGGELAERAVVQAEKFGAHLSVAATVTGLTFDNAYPVAHVEGGEAVTGKCLLIATGADYRLLNVEGCTRLEGCGLYYAATPTEVQPCRGADVIVVGGGNSAGQAAVYLAGLARRVLLVVRGDSLYKDMSSYLARRIEETPTIEVLLNTEVRRMVGDEHLREVELVNDRTGGKRTVPTPAVFSFIGAVPRTDWLPPEVEKDARGFVRTGPAVSRSPHWTLRRQPFLLETSHPGVFAAGDVRSDSTKRVASAVGEGAMAVQLVHAYLREM